MAAPKRRRNPLINMDPDENDINYRYKFEKLITKSEGRNTGQRTVMINLIQIADDILGTKMETVNDNNTQNNAIRYSDSDIKRTAQHITKYIGKKLGSQCQFKKGRNVAIISGVYQQNELQKVIFDYAFQHSMCPNCKLPELTPAIYPQQIKCKSCGYKKKINGKGKKDKRSKKGEKKENKKRKKKGKKQKEVKSNEEIKENELNDIDKEKREKEERIMKNPIFALGCFVKENDNIGCDEIVEKIKILSIAHTLDRKEQIKMIIYVLMEYMDGNYKVLIESIKKYKDIFERYTMLENDTQIFLGYIEEVIMYKSKGDNLLNYAYEVFNCLYDEDIIGEDEVIEWYKSRWESRFSVVNKEEGELIREKAKPFITWLENAENDEEED